MSISFHIGLIGGAPSDASAETLARLEGYDRGQRKNPVVDGASDLWAVGCAETANGIIDYPISWTDSAADEVWANQLLDFAGVRKGELAFLSYIYSLSGHTWPLMRACYARGIRMATGMPTQWDAYRLEMYCRLFNVDFLFGLTPEALDGLEGGGHKLATVLGKVNRIIATGGAWQRLRDAGLAPWKLHWLGPIVAVDPCDGGGARFDHTQWAFESDGGQLRISNKKPRAATFDRTQLKAKGQVETVDGEPRLFLDV